MYRRSFVIKTYFALFNMVLDSFPRFQFACRISIELVVFNEMYWETAGSAGKEENEGGYCPFLCFDGNIEFSIATEFS